jgi:hypothetical protein
MTAHFVERYRRHLQLDIDPIQQWAADLPQIPLNLPWGAPAFMHAAQLISARTSVRTLTDTSPKREHFDPQPIEDTETCNESKRLTRVRAPKTVPPP